MLVILLQAADWLSFFGRFHPLLVHLPIGFLMIAVILELGRRTSLVRVHEDTISLVILWSAIGATCAALAGYFLSVGGGYEEELVDRHMWAGIGVAFFSWCAWIVNTDYVAEKVPFASIFYIPSFLLSFFFLIAAGHDGGTLTHGEGYLTQNLPEPVRSWVGWMPKEDEAGEIYLLDDVEQAEVFRDIIRPVLKTRCVACHGERKQKGGLRLDSYQGLIKGGEDGVALISGKGRESKLVQRCLLPLEDEDHMPPKGKPQLTAHQIALISWWIDHGASADKKIAELPVDASLKPFLESLQKGSRESPVERPAVSLLSEIKADPYDAEALGKAKSLGLIVVPLAEHSNLLEVSAINAPYFGDKDVSLLAPLFKQIVWLNLEGTAITDKSMQFLAEMQNLNRLNLKKVAVSDNGLLQMGNMKMLEYLNLMETRVTDSGLGQLAVMPHLKSVYVWKSGISMAGVRLFEKKNPGVRVINGVDSAAVAKFLRAGARDSSGILETKR